MTHQVKRYRMGAGLGYNEGLVTEIEEPTGEWVRVEDARLAISRVLFSHAMPASDVKSLLAFVGLGE